jgi:hypothetical protein
MLRPACLLDHRIDFIPILHFQLRRSALVLQPLSIKQKPDSLRANRLSGTVGIHQFLQLGRALDLKENFVPILTLDL